MDKLALKGAVDSFVSAYEVAEGRPYPYMIFKNMEMARVVKSLLHPPSTHPIPGI